MDPDSSGMGGLVPYSSFPFPRLSFIGFEKGTGLLVPPMIGSASGAVKCHR
jgi:hypothetical protein